MSDQTPQPSPPTNHPSRAGQNNVSKKPADSRGLLTIVAIFGGLFVVLLIFAVLMLSAFGPGAGFNVGPNQIGVVEILGPITESKKTVKDLHRFAKDENIKAIVVRIDSPGGAVAPSQEMFQAVQRAAQEKPLVVSMGSTAASGGYYIAIGAPHIIANPGTVTGSIGVISQVFGVKGLLDTLDVQVHTLKTGPYKDTGSPFREFNAQDQQYLNALIADIYEQFVSDIAHARKLELAEVRALADGRVFTGRQAKDHQLIDELGSMRDAIDWVKAQAKIEDDETLVYPPEEGKGLLSAMIKGATETAVQEIRAQQTPSIEYRMP